MPSAKADLPGPVALYEIGEGPPLVLFPGLSRRSDPPTEEGLAHATRSYSPLARATGRTICILNRPRGLPAHITMPELARMHAEAIRARFGTPIDLLGISTGGAVALQLAADHPSLVSRLIVVCAASWLGERGRNKLRRYGELVAQGKSGANMLASVLGGPVIRWPLTLLLMLEARGERAIDPSDMLATIHAECGFDVTPRLSEITARTLVIGGESDHAFPPELLRATVAGIRGARLVLYPRRGHVGAMFDPRFGRDVAEFLNT
jgi:pimeloyl-ACP methyl ester carboxylesterase